MEQEQEQEQEVAVRDAGYLLVAEDDMELLELGAILPRQGWWNALSPSQQNDVLLKIVARGLFTGVEPTHDPNYVFVMLDHTPDWWRP
jgi:hypothetical protein